jgi:probable rRNA maturation factor
VIVKKQAAGLTALALSRFVARACRAARVQGKVNVLVTTSREIQALNSRFRDKNTATDVLSFPATQNPMSETLGDIAISAEIAAHNAKQLGHSRAEEIKILALHGVLHLAGFDHERDNGKMAKEEARLRNLLGLPTGLIERTRASGDRAKKRSATSRSRKRR